MAWNTTVPTSSTSPSASCQQFQGNWGALSAWGETEHYVLTDETSGGRHIFTRDKVFTFTVSGTLAVGTAVTVAFVVPYVCTIKKAYAYVRTAPTGSSIILDIIKNNGSIWTDPAARLTIIATANSGSTETFGVNTLAEGDILGLDVDQIGSTIAGADLTVQIKVGQGS